MSLIEKASNIIASAHSEALARRKALVDELQSLLLRNDSPRPGDEHRVSEIVQTLGISADQLGEALSLVREISEYDALSAQEDAILGAYRKAQAGVNAVDEWWNVEKARIDAERRERREAADREFARTRVSMDRLTESCQQINSVRAKWMALTSGITVKEARERMHLA